LQERSFRRLGGRTEQTVDVRVIAATNVDPVEAVKQGKLREDLYYRLNVFAFRLPTLRERKEDLPLLVQAFIAEFNQRNQKSIAGVDQAAMRMIEHYAWPGNVRELRNVIERATILAPGTVHRAEASAAGADRRTARTAAAAAGSSRRARRWRRPSAAHRHDAGAHARQQDARRGDPRHQSEDAAQQAE
jgi:DNA-binding NtrC family response regulator